RVYEARKAWLIAVHHLRQVTELDPQAPSAHCDLGDVLRQARDAAGSTAAYARAIELDPKFARAHLGLGLVLQERQDLPGALAAFEKAAACDPQGALAYYHLGLVLRRQGKFADALKAMQEADSRGGKQAGWAYPSGQMVEQFRRLVQLSAGDKTEPAA